MDQKFPNKSQDATKKLYGCWPLLTNFAPFQK